MTDIEELARDFAIKKHGDQTYGDNIPYSVHLAAVRDILQEFGFDSDYLVAAWLHDVIEDTNTLTDEIERKFGNRVLELVWAVTGIGRTRKERNESAYSKMVKYPDSIILKQADRLANSRSSRANNERLFNMYKSEYPTFKSRLGEFGSTELWEALDRVLE